MEETPETLVTFPVVGAAWVPESGGAERVSRAEVLAEEPLLIYRPETVAPPVISSMVAGIVTVSAMFSADAG